MDAESQANLLKDKGNAELANGNTELAIQIYTEGINLDENNYLLYSNRSAAYAKLGRWREAYSDAFKTVLLKPGWAKGYSRKGLALFHLGNYAEAKIAYQRGLALEPENAQMKEGLAEVIRAEQAANLQKQQQTEVPNVSPDQNVVGNENGPPPLPPKEQNPTTNPTTTTDATTNPPPPMPNRPEDKETNNIPNENPSNEPEIKNENVDLYEVLGVPKDATTGQIKKAYYQKARDYHPDKNESPEAENIFKMISEAYTILSDEDKRKVYDKEGIQAVRESDQGTMDIGQLFKMLFGGDAFEDIFGELSFVVMASQKIDEDTPMEEVYKKLEQQHEEAMVKLVDALIKKIDPYVEGKIKNFESQLPDIIDKVEAPAGASILGYVAYVYIQEGKKHMGKFFGFEGFFAGMEEFGHNFKERFNLISSAVKLQMAQIKLEENGETEEVTQEIMTHGLKTIWKMGKMEIEAQVREVCQRVLESDKNKKKKRAAALRMLGELYREESKKASKTQGIKGIFDVPQQ